MQLTNEEWQTTYDALWHTSIELLSCINELKAERRNTDGLTLEREAIQSLMTKIDRHLMANKGE